MTRERRLLDAVADGVTSNRRTTFGSVLTAPTSISSDAGYLAVWFRMADSHVGPSTPRDSVIGPETSHGLRAQTRVRQQRPDRSVDRDDVA